MKYLALAVALAVAASDVAATEVVPPVSSRFAKRTTRSVPDFQKHVVPLLGRLGCNSAKCHGSFQGQGGLRFSLFGFDFRADHAALHGQATSKPGKRLNLNKPGRSLVLLKPTEQTDHEGGKRFELHSWEHHLLLRWIESGAKGAATQPSSRKALPGKFSAKGITFFRERIQPILENNCYECHGFDSRKGKLQLSSRRASLRGGQSGPAIVSGKPEKSLLIQAVRYSRKKLQMPPSGKLKPREIADLERWVQMGVPWPDRADTNVAGDTDQVLVKLSYEPSEILFRKTGDTSQLSIVAEWKSGEREDVTALCRFQTNDESVVSVDRNGLARSVGAGDTHIVAFYDNGVAAIPVLRPYAKPAPNQPAPAKDAQHKVVERPSEHPVDRLVKAKLDKLGLVPSNVCSDTEFLRRLSIDMTGTLPTPAEVTAFIKDKSPRKRASKIDDLLKRTSYAAWWANKLCDFTGCSPKSISSLLEVAREDGYVKASRWYDWIYARVARNQPYDQLVSGIMLADLSSRDAEGMPFFWTRQSLKAPKDTAMSVAHAFLGIQLQCAECHKHPFDRWTRADFNDFSRFFDSVNKRGAVVREKQQLGLLRSHVVSLEPGDDPRRPIMKWMRRKDNPWFARAFVNRVWAGYFHVGIVNPPDQFTPANPPSNPQLLDWLTQGFINSGYDMKWLHRQITSSDTYQRSWKPNSTNRNDRRNFSRAVPRRIPAEVVYDAMKQATAATEKLAAVRTNLRRRASGHLSMRMAGTHAMRVFGKPERSINCDCERVNEPTLLQAIFVQNDPLVRMRLADSGWIIEIEDAEEAARRLDKRALIRQVWLRTVSRPPNSKEMIRAARHLDSSPSLSKGIRDLMWAMLNTKEFLLNH